MKKKCIDFINESPDVITVGHEHHTKTLFYWTTGGLAFPFGYIRGKLYIGEHRKTHGDIGPNGGDLSRSKMKYPGRMWTNKKVLSFWQYPSTSELKSIIRDLEHTFNTVPVDSYGERDATKDRFDHEILKSIRGNTYGKIKIDGSWRLDVPNISELDDYYDYETFVTRTNGLNIRPLSRDDTGYLYSLSTIFSKKPLKGAGEKLRSGGKLNVDTGKEHMKPPMLKNKNIEKLDSKGKKELWNYFHRKGGGLDPEEKRMYAMLQRNMKREDVEIYVGQGKMIIKEINLFTFDKDRGIFIRSL